MNDENLIPLNKRTKNAQRKIQSMGGKASGKKRRMDKTCREVFSVIRNMPLKDGKLREEMIKAGFPEGEITYCAALSFATVIYGLKGKGDILRVAFEMMGENDVQGVSKIPGALNIQFSDKPEDFKK